MALDTRDYWKRKWNKRTGYKENADFRIGVAEHKRKLYHGRQLRGDFCFGRCRALSFHAICRS